jgi:hypothetical protein
MAVCVTIMTGFSSDDLIYWWSLNYNQCHRYSTHFQCTAAHTLGFSVFTSRLLATDLNTETSTSNHCQVFLSLLLQSLRNPVTQSVFIKSTQFTNCSELHCTSSNSLFNCSQLLCESRYTATARTTQKTQFYCYFTPLFGYDVISS